MRNDLAAAATAKHVVSHARSALCPVRFSFLVLLAGFLWPLQRTAEQTAEQPIIDVVFARKPNSQQTTQSAVLHLIYTRARGMLARAHFTFAIFGRTSFPNWPAVNNLRHCVAATSNK